MACNRRRNRSTAYRFRDSNVLTLTPVASLNSLKLRPSIFMRDKNIALLLGQVFERGVQFLQQHAARIRGFGSGIRRREQVFPLVRLAVFRWGHSVIP